MRTADRARDRDRAKSAVGVAVIHALLGYALLTGLGARMPVKSDDSLKLFDVLLPPLRVEKATPARATVARRQGAASPPNLKAKASEIVAPPSPIPVVIPPPIVAAPTAGVGVDPLAGASNVRGPGNGSGGQGNGTGSGAEGDGEGDGGAPLRWLSGRIKDSDYPRAALEARIGGTVYLRFIVGVKGRVTDCAVTRSSGNAELDETTCRLIKQRFRYKPTRDASGRPVPEQVIGEHSWTVYDGIDPSSGPEG